MEITYKRDLADVDWQAMKAILNADNFDNGRTAEQHQISFQNSQSVCLAMAGDDLVGTARALSDGVCNAYVVDVWTRSDLRHRGIATRMMQLLTEEFHGQHVYLFTEDETVPFYGQLGYKPQGVGVAKVIGEWLQSP